jgi:hypothetical protein
VALLVVASSSVGSAKTEKGLKASDARKLILSLPGVSLNKSAVRVKEVSTTGATAETVAQVRTAFRFQKGRADESGKKIEDDRWFVNEVRVGDRQWEDIDLLSRALKLQGRAPLLSDLEALLTEFAANERARIDKEKRDKQNEPPDDGKGKKEKKKKDAPPPDEGELRRDGILFKGFSPLLSSATVEAEVETGFRFTNDGGRWRVTEIKVGASGWQNLDALLAALNAEKNTRARAELENVKTALEAFRRERGFYVVAEDHAVLIDHLSPQYLPRIVRIDPWHRPYHYTGTRDSYALTSDGPDAKTGTPDDIRLDGK